MARVSAVASGLLVLVSLVPVRSEATEELRVVLRPASQFVVEGEGAPTGFEVDLIDTFSAWIRNKRGKEVSYSASMVSTVPELLSRAQKGECDFAVGSITITDERDRTVA